MSEPFPDEVDEALWDEACRRADVIRDVAEVLASLSPLTREHVNLTGDYIWEDKPALDETGFRPLLFSV